MCSLIILCGHKLKRLLAMRFGWLEVTERETVDMLRYMSRSDVSHIPPPWTAL